MDYQGAQSALTLPLDELCWAWLPFLMAKEAVSRKFLQNGLTGNFSMGTSALIGEQERTTVIVFAFLLLLYRNISMKTNQQPKKTDSIGAGKASGDGAWTSSTGSGEGDFFLLTLKWYKWEKVTESALTWLTAACFSWLGMVVQTEFWW